MKVLERNRPMPFVSPRDRRDPLVRSSQSGGAMQTPRTFFSKSKPQRWMRAGSILISFAAITLLATAFGAHFYSGSLSSVLLTLVLIALCIAIVLHVLFLFLARREHKETAIPLNATEREYKAVFASTLDGIVILDDPGICLGANPSG